MQNRHDGQGNFQDLEATAICFASFYNDLPLLEIFLSSFAVSQTAPLARDTFLGRVPRKTYPFKWNSLPLDFDPLEPDETARVSPFCYCIDFPSTMNKLLSHGYRLDRLALSIAASSRNIEAINEARGIDILPGSLPKRAAPALHWAINHGDQEMLRTLIAMGEDVNEVYQPSRVASRLWTPLTWAVQRGNLEMVRLLLDHHADINLPALYSALHTAIERGSLGIFKALLAHDSCNNSLLDNVPNAGDLLYLAVIRGRLDMVAFLLSVNVETAATQRCFYVAAIWCAEDHSYRPIARMLRDHRKREAAGHGEVRSLCRSPGP
jgi:hypothetical protein